MRERLSFNRAQLKEIFKDFESIKEFERLISLVDSLIPTTITDLDVAAAAADSKAQEALDGLGRIASALEALTVRPQNGENAEILMQLRSVVAGGECAPPAKADNSTATDYIDLPDDAPHVTRERRIQWNMDDGTLDVGLYNGVVLQCGQEVHFYAKNDEATTIVNGSSVMLSGVVGASGKIKVKLAVADGSIDENYMVGVATQDIASGAFGYITIFGLVRGIDATGGAKTVPEVWAEGDFLYFDPAQPGELTKTEPVAPALDLPVALVVNAGAGASGSIYVRMKTGERVNGLHDVSAISPRDLDLLQYNSALSRWESGALPWVDIDFPIIIRTTGAGIPTLAALNGNITMPQWAINDVNICESQELIHGWQEGSTVYWHIHLTSNGTEAANRYVRFELEYGYVDVNGVWTFPATMVSPDFRIPLNTPSKTMFLFVIGSFTPAVKIAGHVVARLKRVVSAGVAPAANPWVPMLQLHVQLDTIGSRNSGTK